ncbi:hypothetical protein ACHMW7_09065 [Aminobacter sp. UC22_36]|uniref:hypothetical protein n=1 Tax=Aminobacter sp. UC22_36 TaxID=3374549 RepID=UPI003756BC55
MASEASISWLSVLVTILFVICAGSALAFVGTLANVIYRLRPLEDERQLSWIERMQRQGARTDRMWVGPEFAKERRVIAWSIAVVIVTMALSALIAPDGV